MDPITALAASGLRARMESLDLLANNVANASTGGFKADREFYSLYSGEDNSDTVPSTMPVIERPWTDYTQGTLQRTGNTLDFALDGHGFFAVNGPSGPLYTRNGSFRLGGDGGDATNLQGGILVLTSLRGADGQVYAVAQGPIVTGGFSSGRGGAGQSVNHPTVGRSPSSAIVERAAPSVVPHGTV